MSKFNQYIEAAINERMEGGAPTPVASSHELTKGAGQSGTTDNFQVEYVGGKFYKLIGNQKPAEFAPDQNLKANMDAALKAGGMSWEQIDKNAQPIDFQVSSNGKVFLRQTQAEA